MQISSTDEIARANSRLLGRNMSLIRDAFMVFLILLVVIGAWLPIFGKGLYANHTFDQVYYHDVGKPVVEHFRLWNVHPWPEQIVKIATTCGCTEATAGKSVPFTLFPAQSFILSVKMQTDYSLAQKTESAYVISADSPSGCQLTVEATYR
jgi:hypothetical protein